MLKYPWWRADGDNGGRYVKKYCVYPDDIPEFVRARSWTSGLVERQQQTLEASLMDLADDITYAIHDLQDFMLAGMLDPTDAQKALEQQLGLMEKGDYVDFGGDGEGSKRARILHEKSAHKIPSPLERAYRQAVNHQEGFADREHYIDALTSTLEYFETDLSEHYAGTLRQDVQIRKAFGDIVGTLVSDVVCRQAPGWKDGPHIHPGAEAWHRILVLKTLGRSLIVDSVHVGVVQRSQRAALVGLLQDLDDWLASSPALKEIPEPLRTYLREDDAELSEHSVLQHKGVRTRRCIADHVSSLTDYKAMQWAAWLRGGSLPVLGDL
ncbi:hypothetical protein ASD16_09340 [Cellulomonas sp. Root485]|nr:hypothetical protein ASD16_09340 [Cellulomonas sp. Root485]